MSTTKRPTMERIPSLDAELKKVPDPRDREENGRSHHINCLWDYQSVPRRRRPPTHLCAPALAYREQITLDSRCDCTEIPIKNSEFSRT